MKIFLCLTYLIMALPAALFAQNSYVEVTAPGNRQLKLAVDSPRSANAKPLTETAREIASVIAFDMNMSGLVSAETRDQLPQSGSIGMTDADFTTWMASGVDLLVRSEYSVNGDELTVEFRLFDIISKKMMAARRYLGKTNDLRRFGHAFADEIMLVLTGERGCFTTRIAYVSSQTGNKEIYIMDWDGHNMLPLTRNGSINLNPDFSPDGREIIFTSYKRGNPDLFKRALSNTVEVPISNRKGLNITGSWSPDGSRIALTLSKDGNSEIYTIAKDGSNPVRVTHNPAIEVSPVWSPDGAQLAFVSDRLGKPQVFISGTKGGTARRLTLAGNYNVNPHWSPKGDRIVYAHNVGGSFQIFSVNYDGTGDTQLTTAGSNENPAWSADGRFITFSSKRGGAEAIYVMRADGSGQTRVSPGKGSSTQPTWSRR